MITLAIKLYLVNLLNILLISTYEDFYLYNKQLKN